MKFKEKASFKTNLKRIFQTLLVMVLLAGTFGTAHQKIHAEAWTDTMVSGWISNCPAVGVTHDYDIDADLQIFFREMTLDPVAGTISYTYGSGDMRWDWAVHGYCVHGYATSIGGWTTPYSTAIIATNIQPDGVDRYICTYEIYVDGVLIATETQTTYYRLLYIGGYGYPLGNSFQTYRNEYYGVEAPAWMYSRVGSVSHDAIVNITRHSEPTLYLPNQTYTRSTSATLEITSGVSMLRGGMAAYSGKTNTLFNALGGTYNGTITQVSQTYMPAISGGLWNSIGVYTQQITARDVADSGPQSGTYPDGTPWSYIGSVTQSRNIIVQATAAPTMTIKYASGAVDPTGVSIAGSDYHGEWTNQPLAITISSSEPGTYDLVLRRGGTEFASYSGPGTYTYPSYRIESGVTGDQLSAIMLDPSNHGTALSPVATQNVKIDLTPPTANATYDSVTGTFADTSTDVLSLINGALSTIAVVPTGETPVTSDYKTFANQNMAPLGLGLWDVWVSAWDVAGNNAVTRVMQNLGRLSSNAPDIKGELASGPAIGSTHPSDTWTNQDVTVIGTADLGDSELSGYYATLNEGMTEVEKAATADTPVEKTYTSETVGTDVTARLVNADGNAVTVDSGIYKVKIDKTKPAANISYDSGTYGFNDLSTDSASLVANSGVDSAKTKVAVVAAGSAEPGSGDYVLISAAGLPASGYWDVWVIATDYAGNESDAVKALKYVNRSMTDSIEAKDFAWDIATGSAALDDYTAIMLSHVYGLQYGTSTQYNLGDFVVDTAQLSDIHAAIDAGLHGTIWPLTFLTPAGANQASVTVNVTLFDNGSGLDTPNPSVPPGPLSHEMIYANDFNWGISAGAIDDGIAKILSKVIAFDKDGDPMLLSTISVDTADLAAINAAIAAGLSGTQCQLTFYSNDGTTVAVKVTLFDNGPGGPLVPGAEYIVGDDFGWGISTGAIGDAAAKVLAHVKATNPDGSNIDLSLVIVDPLQLAAINTAITAGVKGVVLPLTFTTPGTSGTAASVIVSVTLYDNGPAGPLVPGAEHIVGDDFNWGISTGALGDAAAKQLAGILAKDADGARIDLSLVIVDPLQLAAINTAITAGVKGVVLPLTFTTPGTSSTAASVTVSVTLYDNGPAGPLVPGAEHIVGNDFNWGISTGAIDGDTAKILSNVVATDTNRLPIDLVDVTVDATELAAINAAIVAWLSGATLPLTFTSGGLTGDAATTTITVTLFDRGPIPAGIGEDKQHIVGNDFAWGVTSGVLNDDWAKFLSNVKATYPDGADIPLSLIDVNVTDMAAINAAISVKAIGASYPLRFTTPDGTEAKVYVTLYGNGPVVPPVPSGIEHIVGNDFYYGIATGDLNITDSLGLSKVIATDANGVKIAQGLIIVDPLQLAAINSAISARDSGAILPLTFTTPGTSGTPAIVTINVMLWDNTPYTVTYYGNGNTSGTAPVDTAGDAPMGSNAYLANGTVKVLGPGNLAKTGYTFIGWSTTPTGVVIYSPDQTFTINDDIVLYAVWNKEYKVAYDGNGNTGGAAPTDSNSYSSGATVTVLGNTGNLVRTDYTFLGWSTSASATSATYVAGSTFVINSNVTLYAVWQQRLSEPDTYKVTVNDSYATPSGAGTYTPGVTVSINAGVREGYTFVGWTVVSGGVFLANITNTSASFIMPSNDVTVRANWEKDAPPDDDITIIYAPGAHDTFDKKTYTGLHLGDPTPAAPEVTGDEDWVFIGWSPEVSPTVTGSVTYVAQWEQKDDGGSSGAKWALVNLILAVVGGIAALFTLARVFFRKGKDNKESSSNNKSTREYKETKDTTNLLWLAATVIAGIVGIIVFILTENMSLPMRLVDWWTILNAVLLVIGAIGAVFTFNRTSKTSKSSYK